MSPVSRITNVAILGLLISLCLYSDQGFGHVGAAEQIVDTDPHVVLELGTRGILPCRIQRRGYSIDWKRQLSSETELLVSLDLLFNVGERDGPGYETGLFNITDYYSLVIKDVKVQDEGLYICAFIDYQTGKVFRNSTIVFVQAFPDEPFPVIQECIGKDVNSGACILATHQTLNLTCLVRGYYPDIDLSFLHGSEKVTLTEYEEWNNVDGTKNKEIRVQISVSDEPYECVASGLPGMVENRSVSVIVQARSPGANVAAIIAPVLMVVGISLSIAVFFLYRRRNKRGNFSSQGYIAVNTVGDILSRLDDNIHKVAEAISDDKDLRRLGAELELKNSTIRRAIKKNWEDSPKTTNGNNWMLRKWASTITRPDLLMPTLRAALDRAGLTEIGETCLLRDAYETTMPDAVRNLRDKLQARYRKKYSEVKTLSVEHDSLKWLQSIFVSLVLVLKSRLSRDEKTDRQISIEDVYGLIEKESEKGFATRVAFIGEVGVGKSTLFSKIALDWATGKCLPDIDLLFYEPFQDMEETQSFGNLVRSIFPYITQSEAEQIEIYIQANQQKAAILIDDIDETKMNFLVQNHKNTLISVVRGDMFQDTPVLIGTRPFVVDLIKDNDFIGQLYTLIEVKGFTKEGTRQYIKQFFQGDCNSATSLIQFLEWNAMAAELMAPYPVFCAILCNIWKTETKREAIEQLSTISHILKQVYFSLLELYSWKQRNSENGYTYFKKKAEDAMKIVAYVAFEGLMKDQITFDCDQQSIESRKEAADTLYEIGILSKEKKVESRKIRLTEGKHYKEVFRFPHMLLQEFIASFYLSSVCEDSPSKFKEILEDTLLVDWQKYRHLLFFTASQGGKVGKSVMKALCQQVDDVSFIMEVAFECNDKAAFNSVKELLIHKKSVGSDFSTKHIFAAYVYALETYGKQVIEEVKHRPTEGASESTKLHSDPSNYARALCHMPNLRSLELADNYLQNEIFFSTMATEAKNSQIEKLRHVDADLGPDASHHYAKGLCSMPKLQSLELHKVKLTDKFYSTMLHEAAQSEIRTLRMEWCEVNKHILCAILSLPRLGSLSLVGKLSFLDDILERKKKNWGITSVYELSIDGRSMAKLWKLGLHTSCPRVKKLALYFYGEDYDSSDTVSEACSPFQDLTELHINRQKTLDPEKFCKAVKRSCPKLSKLTLTRIKLNNDKATKIIQTMKTHPHLTIIELDTCWTDDSLDPVITEVNSEGKLAVSATHGSI